jgi:hypothetical protein
MRCLKLTGLALMFAASQAIAGVQSQPVYYPEAGDAGDRYTPQNVEPGPWSGFSGSIGDGSPKDTADAFRFYFEGGDFSVRIRFPDPNESDNGEPGEGGQESDLTAKLYTDADRDNALVSLTDLNAGNYVFELVYIGDDPPFSVTLIEPNGGFPQLINAPQATPEPGVLALMLAGLAGLAAFRRRPQSA